MFKLILFNIPYPFQKVSSHALPETWLNELKKMFSIDDEKLNKLQNTAETISLYELLTDKGYRLYDSHEKKHILHEICQFFDLPSDEFQTHLKKALEKETQYHTIETLIHQLNLKKINQIVPPDLKKAYLWIAESKRLLVNPQNYEAHIQNLTVEQLHEIEQAVQVNFQPLEFIFELLKCIEQDLQLNYSYQPLQLLNYPPASIQQFEEYFSRLFRTHPSNLQNIFYVNEHEQHIGIDWNYLSLHLIKYMRENSYLELSKQNMQALIGFVCSNVSIEKSKKFIIDQNFDFNTIGYVLDLISNKQLKAEILIDYLSVLPLQKQLECIFLCLNHYQNYGLAISKPALESLIISLQRANQTLHISESFFKIEIGKKPLFLETKENKQMLYRPFVYSMFSFAHLSQIYETLRYKMEDGETFLSHSLKNFPQEIEFIFIALQKFSLEQQLNCFYDINPQGHQLLQIALTCPLNIFDKLFSHINQFFPASDKASLLLHLKDTNQNLLLKALFEAPQYIPDILNKLSELDISSQVLLIKQLDPQKQYANFIQLIALHQPQLMDVLLNYLAKLPKLYQKMIFTHRDQKKNNIFHLCMRLNAPQLSQLIQMVKNLSFEFFKSLFLEFNDENELPIFILSEFSPTLIETISTEIKQFLPVEQNRIFLQRNRYKHFLMTIWFNKNIHIFEEWLTYFLQSDNTTIHSNIILLFKGMGHHTTKTHFFKVFLNTSKISHCFLTAFASDFSQQEDSENIKKMYQMIFHIYQNIQDSSETIKNINMLVKILFDKICRNNAIHQYLELLKDEVIQSKITEEHTPFFYQLLLILLSKKPEHLITFSEVLSNSHIEKSVLYYRVNQTNLLHHAIHQQIDSEMFIWLVNKYCMNDLLAFGLCDVNHLQLNGLQHAIQSHSKHIFYLFELIQTLDKNIQIRLLTSDGNCLLHSIDHFPILLTRVIKQILSFEKDIIKTVFCCPALWQKALELQNGTLEALVSALQAFEAQDIIEIFSTARNEEKQQIFLNFPAELKESLKHKALTIASVHSFFSSIHVNTEDVSKKTKYHL